MPRAKAQQVSSLDACVLVAVTGWGQEEDAGAREAGFDHHLVKPVEPEQILEVIASYRRP